MLLNFDNVFVESSTCPVRKKMSKNKMRRVYAQTVTAKGENIKNPAGLNLKVSDFLWHIEMMIRESFTNKNFMP